MTLEEMKEKMDRHNKMVSDARAGNDPICPKCKKGHIKCKGKYFFYCDSPECDMKLSMDPVRGSADAFLDLKSSSACPRQKMSPKEVKRYNQYIIKNGTSIANAQ